MSNTSLDYTEIPPDSFDAMQSLEQSIGQSGLDEALIELVKLRASQLNQCAYCVDMHTKRAEELGEEDRKIAAVAAWPESPFFDDRERAALNLSEGLTHLSTTTDEAYEAAATQFTEEELVDLVFTIVAINTWNRLWRSFGVPEIPDL